MVTKFCSAKFHYECSRTSRIQNFICSLNTRRVVTSTSMAVYCPFNSFPKQKSIMTISLLALFFESRSECFPRIWNSSTGTSNLHIICTEVARRNLNPARAILFSLLRATIVRKNRVARAGLMRVLFFDVINKTTTQNDKVKSFDDNAKIQDQINFIFQTVCVISVIPANSKQITHWRNRDGTIAKYFRAKHRMLFFFSKDTLRNAGKIRMLPARSPAFRSIGRSDDDSGKLGQNPSAAK